MKKLFVIIAAFAAAASLRADTSYLLIQGPFGSGGIPATFKWQVNYQPGALVYGQDLLNSVFGTPTINGTYSDAFGGVYDFYNAGNSTQGVGYYDYDPAPNQFTAPFLISITLGSTPVAQATDYSLSWTYSVAGGGSNLGNGYANSGAWTVSEDGLAARTLVNGSFDSFGFGSYPATINDAANAPTAANFSGATVINVVPEPTGAALLLIGVSGLLAFAKRRRA